jgi:SRSO17 transposase
MLLDRCQQIVATEHASLDATGCIDETGTTKSGKHTAGVKRQYNGNRGKVENCVDSVALSYSAPGFSCLLDARLYLPEEWTTDPVRRKQNHSPDDIVFRTKPQIALELLDRALRNGIQVLAWTADALYRRDSAFLDGLHERCQAYVVEIPPNARVWLVRPKLRKRPPRKRRGSAGKSRRKCRHDRNTSQVRHLATCSPAFREQTHQRYRIKDTHHGPEVWEIR